MAQETLNRIKETELMAQKLVQDARDEGAGMIEQAKKDAQKYKEDLLGKAREDARKALADARSGLEPALQSASVRAEAVTSQFSKNLDARREEAIQLVISHIAG